MTTIAPWAVDALDSLLSATARPLVGSHWVADAEEGAIELGGGYPDPGSLPAAALLAAARTVLEREPVGALQYGGTQGFLGLRELIASRVAAEPGVSLGPENIAITNGGWPALQNVCQTFLDPGDVILVDAPAWGGFLRLARALGVALAPMPLDEQGPQIEHVAETLHRLRAEGKRVKLIYTIPTFQNPMGITFTVERRQALVELAARHRILIVEDDPYGELRFTDRRLPSLYALSGGEGVLKAGTFSKVIAPGLRVGWLQGRAEYINAALRMRFDNGTSPFLCRVIAAYIEQGALEPHIEELRGLYRSRCDAMLSALAESCAKLATWTHPDGGFFIWLTVRDDIDLDRVMRNCAEERVSVVPGTSFFVDGGGRHNLRLTFSCASDRQIAEGIRRLARALDRARV